MSQPQAAKVHRAESTNGWSKPLPASENSERTINPIRAIVDHIQPNPECPLKPIPLSIGDPTLDGNLLPPANYIEAIAEAARSATKNGYPPSVGYPFARQAVAAYLSSNFIRGGPNGDLKALTADDIVLASGASHAIEMCINALCNAGDEILLPAPCFSLYGVIMSNRGVVPKHYQLDSSKKWESDLADLEKKVTPKTKAIWVTNPSNPCGSNFSASHVRDIVALADRLHLPIIADEIYAGLVFDVREREGAPKPTFTSVGLVSASVPCLIVGGIAKTYVVPGHRIGWVARHDPKGVLGNVWGGIHKLSTLIVGPNSLCQAALPNLLEKTPAEYHETLRTTLRDQACLCRDLLAGAPGIETIEPQGAMYLMVKIDFSRFNAATGIKDDKEFAKALVKAKNVVVLPGSIFEANGYIRIVFTKPPQQLREAIERIVDFVKACSA